MPDSMGPLLEPPIVDPNQLLAGVERRRRARRIRRLALAGLLLPVGWWALMPSSVDPPRIAVVPGTGGVIQHPDGFSLELGDQRTAAPIEVRWSTPQSLDAVPGSGHTELAGVTVPLQGLGFAQVELWSEGAPHTLVGTAKLGFPLVAQHGFQDGDSVGLYGLDQDGVAWVHEGEAHVRRGRIEAEVAHFSWWAAQEPVWSTGCVCGTVDHEAVVTAVGLDGLLRSRTLSRDGRFCVDTLAGARLNVQANGVSTCGTAAVETHASLEPATCTEVDLVLDACAEQPAPIPPDATGLDGVRVYLMSQADALVARCDDGAEAIPLSWSRARFDVPVGAQCTLELHGQTLHRFRAREGLHRLYCDSWGCSEHPLPARPTRREQVPAAVPGVPKLPPPAPVPSVEPTPPPDPGGVSYEVIDVILRNNVGVKQCFFAEGQRTGSLPTRVDARLVVDREGSGRLLGIEPATLTSLEPCLRGAIAAIPFPPGPHETRTTYPFVLDTVRPQPSPQPAPAPAPVLVEPSSALGRNPAVRACIQRFPGFPEDGIRLELVRDEAGELTRCSIVDDVPEELERCLTTAVQLADLPPGPPYQILRLRPISAAPAP